MGPAPTTLNLCGVDTPLLRAGRGAPLLILQGASNVEGWLPFYDRLAQTHDVLLPAHPGFSGLPAPEWLERIADLANFHLELIHALDLKNVRLLGLSMGGWVAAELAARDCSRLAALALVAPSGLYLPGAEPLDVFLRTDEQLFDDLFHDKALGARWREARVTPESEDLRLQSKVTTAKLAWSPRWYDPHLRKWLHRARVPATIVWGADDAFLAPAHAQEWRRLIPGAQAKIIEACGHHPHIEQPEALHAALASFLNA
jgi:pimeloyl-ACP methyl ester carboxylesterase